MLRILCVDNAARCAYILFISKGERKCSHSSKSAKDSYGRLTRFICDSTTSKSAYFTDHGPIYAKDYGVDGHFSAEVRGEFTAQWHRHP